MSDDNDQPVRPDCLANWIQNYCLTMPHPDGMDLTQTTPGTPSTPPEPLDEDVFEHRESKDYLVPYLRAIKQVADQYNKEYTDRDYPDSSWQARSISYLDKARTHLGVLIKFLETAENQQLAQDTLGAVFRASKRYAELLGPVMVSFGVVIILEWTETRLHRRHLRMLKVDLDEVDDHLKHLEYSLPLVAELLEQAGRRLESMLQYRSQPHRFNRQSREFDDLFRKMTTEIAIAEDRLRRVDSLIVRLHGALETYRSRSILQYGLVMTAGVNISWLLRSRDVLDSKTAVILATASSAPLLYFYLFLSVDIQDMLTEVRKRERRQVELGMELSALHRRLRVLKTNRSQTPQQETDEEETESNDVVASSRKQSSSI